MNAACDAARHGTLRGVEHAQVELVGRRCLEVVPLDVVPFGLDDPEVAALAQVPRIAEVLVADLHVRTDVSDMPHNRAARA